MFSAQLVVRSKTLDVEELVTLLDAEPRRSIRRGDPLSRRKPDGLRHDDSAVFYSSNLDDPDLGPHIVALRPLIDRTAAVLGGGADVEPSLLVAVTVRQMGWIVTLERPEIATLAAAGMAVEIDCYDSDPSDFENGR